MNVPRTLSALALVATGIALAQLPVHNINPKNHGNMAAAQRLADQAFKKIVAAQQANEDMLGGHAQKAKGFLDQANRELDEAAVYANQHDRK